MIYESQTIDEIVPAENQRSVGSGARVMETLSVPSSSGKANRFRRRFGLHHQPARDISDGARIRAAWFEQHTAHKPLAGAHRVPAGAVARHSRLVVARKRHATLVVSANQAINTGARKTGHSRRRDDRCRACADGALATACGRPAHWGAPASAQRRGCRRQCAARPGGRCGTCAPHSAPDASRRRPPTRRQSAPQTPSAPAPPHATLPARMASRRQYRAPLPRRVLAR
jgi:hypothetical protein